MTEPKQIKANRYAALRLERGILSKNELKKLLKRSTTEQITQLEEKGMASPTFMRSWAAFFFPDMNEQARYQLAVHFNDEEGGIYIGSQHTSELRKAAKVADAARGHGL